MRWCTKTAISQKRVKIEEKLLWSAYRKSSSLVRMVSSPTLYDLPFPSLGFRPDPKLQSLLSHKTGKITDFIFGRNIYRVHPSKSLLKISRKGTLGVSGNFGNSSHMHRQGILHIFRSPIHWVHRAVIFAIARLSCFTS